MTEPSQNSKSPKTEPEKKVPETVLLTSDELRAIAGGAGVSNPTPAGNSGKAIINNPQKLH
jgi:hypothetical protein